jgi:hypothetical protein
MRQRLDDLAAREIVVRDVAWRRVIGRRAARRIARQQQDGDRRRDRASRGGRRGKQCHGDAGQPRAVAIGDRALDHPVRLCDRTRVPEADGERGTRQPSW